MVLPFAMSDYPYYPQQPPQPVKKGHALRNIILGGLGCILVAGVAIFLIYLRFFSINLGPSRTVQHHLRAINQGRVPSAYGDFSNEFTRRHTLVEFEQELSRFSDQLPCRSSHISRIAVNNNKAEVGGTLTGKDGALFPIKYVLVREKGVWKIQDYHWEPPGEMQSI